MITEYNQNNNKHNNNNVKQCVGDNLNRQHNRSLKINTEYIYVFWQLKIDYTDFG